MSIPKRIVQVWGGPKPLPPLGHASAVSLKLHHPDYEYTLFDDEAIRQFLETQATEHRDIYHSFPAPIQRYDFLRYLIIYDRGGYYFDSDIVLRTPLHDLASEQCVFPFDRLTWSETLRSRYGMDWEMGNYGFGAEPKHPFLRAVIDNCVRGQRDPKWAGEIIKCLPEPLREDLRIIYATGPGLVTRTLAENPDLLDQVRVLFPRDVFAKIPNWSQFGEYAVHLGAGGWRPAHPRLRRWVINYLALRNEARAMKFTRHAMDCAARNGRLDFHDIPLLSSVRFVRAQHKPGNSSGFPAAPAAAS